MAVVIKTPSTTYSIGGHRRTAVTSAGVIWHMEYNPGVSRWEFWYSSDDGATWTENTSLRITPPAGTPTIGSFYINRVSNVAVCCISPASSVRVIFGITSASTAWTSVASTTYGLVNDVVIFQKPSSTNYIVAAVGDDMRVYEITNAGVYVGTPVALGNSGSTYNAWADFEHLGDGATPTTSPAIIFTRTDTASPYNIEAWRYSWTGTTWSIGTYTVGAFGDAHGSSGTTATVHDGTRHVVIAKSLTANTFRVTERIGAGTPTSTLPVSPALASSPKGLVATYDHNQDILLAAGESTSGDIFTIRYSRATGTWDTSWTLIEAASIFSAYNLSAPKSQLINDVWPVVWFEPTVVKTENVATTRAPTATMTPLAALSNQDLPLPVSWASTDLGTTTLADSFDRANSTTTLGAFSNRVWQAQNASVWGITSNKAYCVTAAPDNQNHVLVDTGASDCTIEVTIAVTGDGGLAFRAIDNLNLFVTDASLGLIYRWTAGAYTTVCTLSQTFASGDVQRVRMIGSSIEVFKNGVSVGSFTDTQGQTATKHGLRNGALTSTVHFDNFSITHAAWALQRVVSAATTYYNPQGGPVLVEGPAFWLPGTTSNYLTTPDSAELDPPADVEIVVRVGMADWTPAATQTIIAKHATPGTTANGYSLNVLAAGTLNFAFGATTAQSVNSTVATGFANGARRWLKVTYDSDNGASGRDIKFWTAPDSPVEPLVAGWTQLGATVTQATASAITSNTTVLFLGATTSGANPMSGVLLRAILRNGINGTTVFDVGGTDLPTPSASSFAAKSGQTITVNRSAATPVTTIVPAYTSVYVNPATWDVAEVKNSGVDLAVTLSVPWKIADAVAHAYSVKLWNFFDVPSTAYSTAASTTPTIKYNPTIVSPASGDSFKLTTTSILVDWTVGSQSEYKVSIFLGDVMISGTDWVVSGATQVTMPVALLSEQDYSVRVQTKNSVGFLSDEVMVDIYAKRGPVLNYVPTDKEVITTPTAKIIRYVDIFESDGVTPWRLRAPVSSGEVAMDGATAPRRSLQITLANPDQDIVIDPEDGLWYDKVVRPYRGVQLADGTERVWPLGVFHIDTLNDQHFPFSIDVQGRDKFKVLEKSRFLVPTQFSRTHDLFTVIRGIAVSGGITAMSVPTTAIVLGEDVLFDQDSSREDAIIKLTTAFGYDVSFDASGTMIVEEFADPYAGGSVYSFHTGDNGEIINWRRQASDSMIYNVIVVVGESSRKVPVTAKASNNDPNSPTRISRIGERSKTEKLSTVTTQVKAQELANKWLKIAALEQFTIDVESLVVPWLSPGKVIEVVTERQSLSTPTRFLLSSVSIPFGMAQMSLTGRRLVITR